MITVERSCCGGCITARAFFSGRDLCVLVSGGDSPHIGSVSVGIPRKSLTGSDGNSATVSTFTVTGHKDDVIGNMFALRLASEFFCITSVSCGIHFDGLHPDAIKAVVRDADSLAADLVAAIKNAASLPPA